MIAFRNFAKGQNNLNATNNSLAYSLYEYHTQSLTLWKD